MKKYVKKKIYSTKNQFTNKNSYLDIDTNNNISISNSQDNEIVVPRKISIGLHLNNFAKNNTTTNILDSSNSLTVVSNKKFRKNTSRVTSKLQYFCDMVSSKLRPCVKKRKSVDERILCSTSHRTPKLTSSPKSNVSFGLSARSINIHKSSSLRNSKYCKTPVKFQSQCNTEKLLSQSFGWSNDGKSSRDNNCSPNVPTQIEIVNNNMSPTKLLNIQNLAKNDNNIVSQSIIQAIQSSYNLSKDFVLTSEGLKKIVFPPSHSKSSTITTNNMDHFFPVEFGCNSSVSSRPVSSQSLSISAPNHNRTRSDSYCSYNTLQHLTLTSEDDAHINSFSNSHKKHILQNASLRTNESFSSNVNPNNISILNQQYIVENEAHKLTSSKNESAVSSISLHDPNKSSTSCIPHTNIYSNGSEDIHLDMTKKSNINGALCSNTSTHNPSVNFFCPEPFLRDIRCCYSVKTWENMISSENSYAPRTYYFHRQKYVSIKTRAILVGWLSEVCDAFKLHRETYYLAINYVDRYLSCVNDIRCNQLQLLGVTALYVASKLEEIYPPNIRRFVNVTDGATTVEQVITQELALVKTLNWQLNEMTAYGWLAFFTLNYENFELLKPYSVCYCSSNSRSHHSTRNQEKRILNRGQWNTRCFEFPTTAFKEIIDFTKLLEIVVLDAEFLKYPSVVIAASIFFIVHNYDSSIINFTGLQLHHIESCVRWMHMYDDVVRVKCPNSPVPNNSELSASLSSCSSQISLNSSFSLISAINDDDYNVQRHRDAIKYIKTINEKVKPSQDNSIGDGEINNLIVDGFDQ